MNVKEARIYVSSIFILFVLSLVFTILAFKVSTGFIALIILSQTTLGYISGYFVIKVKLSEKESETNKDV